jgi:PQQ-like domain
MRTNDLPDRAATPGGGTALLLREPCARVRARRAVLASLLAFSLIAEALVAGIGTAYEGAWFLLVGVGFLGIILAVFDDLRWRVREVPPHRSIQRLLVITPESESFRDAPRPLALQLDGQPVLLGAAPRLEVTRAGGHYDVNLVLDHEILVLDSLGGHEAAIARSGELATALGLSPPLGDQTVGAPAVSERSETYLILVMLFTMLSAFSVVYWFAHTDISDHVALPLTLAAVLLGSLFATGRRLCLRRLRSEAEKDTRFSPHLSTAAVGPRGASRDRDKVILFALSGLIVVTVIAAQRLGAQDLPESSQCWQSAGPRLCGIDVTGDGVPEAIGYICVGRGPWASSELSAIDARSGETTVPLNRVQSSSVAACEAPFLVLNNSSAAASSDVSAHRTLVESPDLIWRISLRGEVKEILQSKGCALILTHTNDREDEWSTFSLSTGGPCDTLPQPVSPEVIARARQERQQGKPTPSVRTADDVGYSVTASPRLTLSASRGDLLLWRTELPARALDELPLAVAGGTVVVGAKDLRTGKYLRIVGVDASTGQIRYVRRHPRVPKAHVDLAAAGAMVFIEAGRLAGLDAVSGKIAWITKGE